MGGTTKSPTITDDMHDAADVVLAIATTVGVVAVTVAAGEAGAVAVAGTLAVSAQIGLVGGGLALAGMGVHSLAYGHDFFSDIARGSTSREAFSNAMRY